MAVDELPAEVEALLVAAGVEWPYLNERALRQFVEALRGFRGGMLRIHLDATDSLARIAREQSPRGAEETLADWDGHAAAFVFGVADQIEAFCRGFEDWVARIAVDKAAVLQRLRVLASEVARDPAAVGARGGDGGSYQGLDDARAPDGRDGARPEGFEDCDTDRAVAFGGCDDPAAEIHRHAKDLLAELDARLEGEAGVMFGERLEPLLSRIADSAQAMGGTSSLLRGEGTFAPGADIETVYLHIDRFRGYAEAMTECSQKLMASMRGLDFAARPGGDALSEPVPEDVPAEGYAVWRGHVYRAERVTHSAVRLSLLPGDARPPVAPELGGWPYTGSLLLWPAQLDTWIGPAVPGLQGRADLLELWRLRFAEEAFRYFTPVFADPAARARGPVPEGPFAVGEFARWRGRVYGAQTMPDDSARLFPLSGDDRTPVLPDLARHARGMWASPIELEEWYSVCTTFYVGDDAYLAVGLADGMVEGLRAYTADPVRESFPVEKVVDLQEERRDLLAEWKWKVGI